MKFSVVIRIYDSDHFEAGEAAVQAAGKTATATNHKPIYRDYTNGTSISLIVPTLNIKIQFCPQSDPHRKIRNFALLSEDSIFQTSSALFQTRARSVYIHAIQLVQKLPGKKSVASLNTPLRDAKATFRSYVTNRRLFDPQGKGLEMHRPDAMDVTYVANIQNSVRNQWNLDAMRAPINESMNFRKQDLPLCHFKKKDSHRTLIDTN